MVNNCYLLPEKLKTVQIVQMNSILYKVLRKNLLGDFTQSGGVSALSALFVVCLLGDALPVVRKNDRPEAAALVEVLLALTAQ